METPHMASDTEKLAQGVLLLVDELRNSPGLKQDRRIFERLEKMAQGFVPGKNQPLGLSRDLDIAWLAGLLEGEGCFSRKAPRTVYERASIRVVLRMTDRDTVKKAVSIFPTKNEVRPYPREHPHKTLYEFTWCGVDAEQVMRAISPYMCERRGQK